VVTAALQVVQIQAGSADNFSYLVICPESGAAMAVDPSFAPECLLAEAAARQVRIEILANTHGHMDHVAGNGEIIKATGAELAAHPLDLSKVDIPLAEGTRLGLGQGCIEVLHTPGHTPGGLVFRVGGGIITGDTLFVSRCGRADLPGSDVEQLYTSLQRLKRLPPETVVYPGHDYGPTPTSTLAWELENNQFLRCPDLAGFISLRMG